MNNAAGMHGVDMLLASRADDARFCTCSHQRRLLALG